MTIYVVTINDSKFNETYRNFCYKNINSLKQKFNDDFLEHINNNHNSLKEEDEKNIADFVKKITNPLNVHRIIKLKGFGIEGTFRKEDLK